MNTPASQPTLKLSVAFAGMYLLVFDYAIRDLLRAVSVAWVLLITPASLWIVWTGVFKSSGLQLLWGWPTFLLGSFASVVLACRLAFGALMFMHVASPQLLLHSLLVLPTGWLLVFERDLKRFMAHLRKLEDQNCKLRTWD